MPEHDCLPGHVSAAEFLTHMAEVSGLPPSAARTRAADTLRHTGLFEERYRAMGGYSTGMKQRVKLGQALVDDPAVVFLDEPTAGLDPVGREEMLSLVRKTYTEFGISVLISSHLMADVERTCDRILVLQGGRLVQSGDVRHFTKETERVFIEVGTNRDRLVAALEARAVRHRFGAWHRAGRRSHAMAAYTTTLAMLTASFTTRRAYAAVFLVGLFVITTPFTAGLASEIEGPAGQWISMFNLTNIPVHVNDLIFGEVSEITEGAPAGQLPAAVLIAWYFAWTIIPGAVLWARYRRLSP